MPVKTCQKEGSNLGSPVISDKGIQRDDGLSSAVFISLGTDLRVDGEGGWWQETYIDRPIGSKLWSLRDQKITTETLALAVQYTQEALQWMIDDGMATAIEPTIEVQADDTVRIFPNILLINGTRWQGYVNAL